MLVFDLWCLNLYFMFTLKFLIDSIELFWIHSFIFLLLRCTFLSFWTVWWIFKVDEDLMQICLLIMCHSYTDCPIYIRHVWICILCWKLRNLLSNQKTNCVSAKVASRPGKHGRADGYILEGKELDFYLRKIKSKKGK